MRFPFRWNTAIEQDRVAPGQVILAAWPSHSRGRAGRRAHCVGQRLQASSQHADCPPSPALPSWPQPRSISPGPRRGVPARPRGVPL